MRSMLGRYRAEDGISLVEVLIATFVLAVGVLAVASVAGANLISLNQSQLRQRASTEANALVERLRQPEYDDLAMLDTAVAAGTFDPDGTGPLGAETLARSGTGVVTTAAPWSSTAGGVTIDTYVTLWCRDPSLPCDTVGTEDARRVTVVASWVLRQETRELRRSTIIAETER